MITFEIVVALLIGALVLSTVAPRMGVPWPSLLAVAGAGLAAVPGMPEVALDPKLALALFVAPILLDSGYDASPRDLRSAWAPVASLVLGAVALTVAAVAVATKVMVPAMPWAACITLGAIVAPPDAAAAAAVLRQVRLPHRLVVILEGESLLNDASALLIYRVAAAASVGGVTVWTGPLAALAALGGVVAGYALAKAAVALIRHMPDEITQTVSSFLIAFGVWLLADALQLSAVLTVVAFAVTIARTAPEVTPPRSRLMVNAVWSVAVFVLNLLAFVLIGLQLRGILERLDGSVWDYLGVAAGVLATCIGVRFAWIMLSYAVVRLRAGREPDDFSVRGGLVVSWCGMRGIVTLAAAFALPAGFPSRDLVVFAAFATVLGTLVLQGMTLRPLLRSFRLPDDTSVDDEVAAARREMAQAALDRLGRAPDHQAKRDARELLQREYRARLPSETESPAGTGLRPLRRLALAAERERLIDLRRAQSIGEDAFHQLENELDWAQAAVEQAPDPVVPSPKLS